MRGDVVKTVDALWVGNRGIQALIDEIQRRPGATYDSTRVRRQKQIKTYREAQAALRALIALLEDSPQDKPS
jgi:hypothetical protein